LYNNATEKFNVNKLAC